MSENNDLKNGTEIIGEKRRKGKIPGSLITVTLIIAAALLLFALANNWFSTDTRAAQNGFFEPGKSSCCSFVNPAADRETNLATAALDYYRVNYGSTDGLQASVEDFGCHQEITISRDNQLVKRFGFNGNTFYELTP